jgi:hypothetical protein
VAEAGTFGIGFSEVMTGTEGWQEISARIARDVDLVRLEEYIMGGRQSMVSRAKRPRPEVQRAKRELSRTTLICYKSMCNCAPFRFGMGRAIV